MIVEEPCNYVSNVAFYHAATRVCTYPDWNQDVDFRREIKRGFYILSMGSSFWHASHTYLGYQFDNNMIALISYISYQGMVSPIINDGQVLNTQIRDISPLPRKKTGVEVS